jgi:hypothetical protein
MSCCSRYARFSGVSFVLVRYMSATLFMSCSMWLYLSLISVNFPDASPESWWMIYLLDNVSFVLCDTWLLVIKFLL